MICTRKVLTAILVVAACLALYACDGTETQGGSMVEVTESTPESLASAVVETWSDSMQELVTLLEGRPAASSVMSKVQELKENTIQNMVAFGRQRDTLSAAEKSQVDSLEWSALQGLSEESWYTTYSEVWSYYAADDVEFGNVLAAFNTLTQYSDFELLKQQLPEEAARLGVE